MYEEIYQCRLCKEEFVVACGHTRERAMQVVGVYIASTSGLHLPHGCDDGGVGVADFVGMRVKENTDE